MKKIYLSLLFIGLLNTAFAQVSITPNPFEVDDSITITIDINSNATNCNGFNNPNKVYMHSGIGDESNPFGFSVIGNYGQDDGVGQMASIGNGLYSITITPETYYNITQAQANSATRIGMVFRNENGSQEFKGNGCSDFVFEVGSFQVTLNSPAENEATLITSGDNVTISASNTNGSANYVLSSNGSVINTQNNTSSYNYTFNNITSSQFFELQVTQNTTIITKSFSIVVNPGNNEAALPSGLKGGINYDQSDPTKATLVLDAPLKDFIYVAGSFNNWQPTSAYAMKKDPSSTKFWLEINGLTSGQIETYQYWAFDETPIANSPNLVKAADPYSTLVLSPFDDPSIPASSYPNIPSYPQGQEREVTVLQTGQTQYNWQVPNFSKPKKEDLIIYEVLVRDFDINRNYQDLIDRIDYFKNLNVNAIQLMPVMEFEGNESWGYNTAFHMALDKFYGTPEKFKELVDVCHQNGIAVILDIAFNHAYGRNPLVRMWMDDPDGDGWGGPSSENPYFNQTAQHSYSVGSDFNHTENYSDPNPSSTTTNPIVNEYVEQVIEYWIEEYKIDGFRWDLTKGFTQKCTSGNNSCTDGYQQDRVDILKSYADMSWAIDPDHYVIFEHLGTANEEKEWANYRFNEGKGIMMWGKMTSPYNELTKGTSGNKNISGIGHKSRSQFSGPRVIGYPESHDEERLMYNNKTSGNSSNPSHNVQNLDVALSRMSAMAAVSVMVPGPKMIWHFGELGMDNSIFTCTDGSYNNDGCKLSTKPQPQWNNNWLSDALRGQIYDDWSKLHKLKTTEAVFEGDYTITTSSSSYTPRIDIFDTSIPNSQLKNVVIFSNFNVSTTSVSTNFPDGVTSTWYDLMDPTGNTTVSDLTLSISIPAGQFRIFGNRPSTALSVEDNQLEGFSVYPNPTASAFSINLNTSKVEVFDLTGKLVKSFKGNFTRTHIFEIPELKTGIYLVKAQNENNQTKTTKLVKL